MDIKQSLWNAFKKDETVQIMTHFRGIPVTGEAEVLMIGQEVLALKVEPRFMPPIRHERRLYMECCQLPNLMKATPIAFEHRESIIILDQLEVASPNARHRLALLHIQPETEVTAALEEPPFPDQGILLDLTPEEDQGLSFRLLFNAAIPLRRNDRIRLKLGKPARMGITGLAGSVMHLHNQPRSHQTRLLIQVMADPGLGERLIPYLAARKRELEAEWSQAV